MAASLTPHQTAALTTLRRDVAPLLATPHDAAFADDAALCRFLTARDWDVPAAAAKLADTLAWRRAHLPPGTPRACAECDDAPGTHCIVPLGRAAGGQPIVWGCPARGRSSDGPSTVAHVVAALEHVFSLAESAPTWVRGVWVGVGVGFGWGAGQSGCLGRGYVTTRPSPYLGWRGQ